MRISPRDCRSCSPQESGRLPPIAISLLSAGFVVLAVARPGLGDTWVDSRTLGPFVCRADFHLDGSEALFADLHQLESDLVEHLGLRPARESIELYFFRDERSYRRYLARHLPQVPYRRALYVNTGGAGMVFAYRSKEFAVDVRHECTHALLHASLPMVPLWLDEGLAE